LEEDQLSKFVRTKTSLDLNLLQIKENKRKKDATKEEGSHRRKKQLCWVDLEPPSKLESLVYRMLENQHFLMS